MKSTLLLFAWLLFPFVLTAQNTALPYQIYDVKNQKVIELDELISNIKNTDVLFFGEEHNDSTGHVLEMAVFEKMSVAYPGTALSMEMFATDVQPVLNEYLAGLISEKNFIKEARAWNNYNDYKPLITFAKKNKLNVIGANAATRYSNAVTYSGLSILEQFPPSSKPFLPPLPVDTATGRYHEKFLETMGGHDMGSMKIYQTQNLWDATMAWSIASHMKSNSRKKILQINGRFHSDEKLGTVAQLKKYAPRLKVAAISCFTSADFAAPEWAKHAVLADYIIISPQLKKQQD